MIQLKREAKLKGGFYVEPEAKLLFIIRIRGYVLNFTEFYTLTFYLLALTIQNKTFQYQCHASKDTKDFAALAVETGRASSVD